MSEFIHWENSEFEAWYEILKITDERTQIRIVPGSLKRIDKSANVRFCPTCKRRTTHTNITEDTRCIWCLHIAA